jgi:thymidylate kinase
MESAGDDFHDRVRRGYTELARTEGWVVVDGSGSPDEVEAAVFEAVSGRLHW